MNYFNELISNIKNDKSEFNLLNQIINPFSTYFLCDHFFGTEIYRHGIKIPDSKNDILKTRDLTLIKDYDIVQCEVDFFERFCSNILQKLNVKIILITSQWDYPQIYKSDITEEILKNKNIILWISQNPVYDNSDNYIAFPYGIRHTALLSYANKLVSSQNIKTIKVNHQHLTVENNKCRNLLPPVAKMNINDYLNEVSKSYFFISPIGDRDDCYRHYECIGLGTIPITNVSKYYKNLFGDNMYYTDITNMLSIINNKTLNDFEYFEPDKNLICYNYYKDQVLEIIKKIKYKDLLSINSDETKCSIVSSRGILKSCDIKSLFPLSSVKDLQNYNFNKLKDKCTLYVCSSAIYFFMKNYIDKINCKFILVSGDDDACCPRDMFTSREEFLKFIENEKIIHWFAQNNVKEHNKITKIPIGLDYHTISSSNYKSNNINEIQLTPIEQEKIILDIKNNSLPFWEREIKCYSNFHFVLENKYCYDRIHAIEKIPPELIFYEPTRSTKETGFINQSKYAFVVSPHGMGLDCHRTWEAISLGCIVIVKTSELDKLYEDLPVLIVNKWSDINIDLLKITIKNFKDKIFKYEKILLEYWINKINSYRNINT
jgi:hypothetical protein